MLDINRHIDIFNPSKFDYPVHLIGCGGMGSRIAEGLVRMGLGRKDKNPIYLYDHDIFENHNLANQWAALNHLGKFKAQAVRSQMFKINPLACISAYPKKVETGMLLTGVVFICIDSMGGRKNIMEEVIANSPEVKCVIETRMDAGVGVSHCFDPRHKKQLQCWRMYWHPDSQADNLVGCGGVQSIISTIYGTTALALKQLEQFAKNKTTYGVPNRIYHDFEECIINTEVWS